MDEDGSLLRKFVHEGSQTAFETLVRRHLDFVFGVALRITRNPDRARDIAQTVFADLCRKARPLCRRKNLAGWLHRAASYASLRLLRTEARRGDRERAALLNEEESGSVFEAPDIRPLIDEALLRLGESDRAAVLLRFFKNLSFPQIGAELGLNESTARMRVNRGMGRLRRHLSRRGITSTAAALEFALEAQASIKAPIGLASSIAAAGSSAAVGVLAIPGVVAFMTTSKLISGGLALAAVAGFGGFYLEHQARTREQQAMVALTRQASVLQAKVRHLEAERRPSEGPKGPLSYLAAPNDAANRVAAAPVSAGLLSTSATPSLAQIAQAHLKYDPFLRKWGLGQDQMDRFAYLMAEKEIARLEVQAAVRAEGLTDTPAVDKLSSEATQPYWDQMKDLLGPQAWSDFRNYEASYFYQNAYVAPAQNSIAQAGGPMTAEQSEQLAAIIAANHQTYKSDPSSIGSSIRIDWLMVVQGASSVLTSSQLAGLRAYVEKRQANDDKLSFAR